MRNAHLQDDDLKTANIPYNNIAIIVFFKKKMRGGRRKIQEARQKQVTTKTRLNLHTFNT